MKTSEQIQTIPTTMQTDFHAVDFFRNVKEQIAKEIEGMSYEQIKQYFAEKLKESKLASLQR